jgi:hypothetical protein
MDQYEHIRTAHRVYGKSIRGIRRETGHHRQTIRNALAGKEPKYRRKKAVACPVMDPVADVVEKWLREDRDRPLENNKVVKVKAGTYQTVQVDRNRYSVPRAYVGRWLWARIGCEKVRVYSQQKQVAEHVRVFSAGKWQLDPLHYLGLLEQRVGAFEAARPIRQWRAHWPESYEQMLRRLRRRQGESEGTREFVRILQLHAEHPGKEVEAAIRRALQLAALSYEAVKHLLLRAEEETWDPAPLRADFLPGVTDRDVTMGELNVYEALLAGGGR